MARYNIRQSKTDKFKETAGKLLKFDKQPIVIPRDKLEAANMKVLKFQKQNKKMKYAVGFLVLYACISLWMLLK